MQLTTTHAIENQELELLGLVKGLSSSKEQAFDEALKRLQEEATFLKADAVIGIQCSICPSSNNQTQMFVYGTAVKFRVSTDLQQF
ncbi:MAG: heavy metal-binding domain-containing protein [Clostridiales bacterium]|jgi:uncharacterized protein YbjQ (UPF0145 family)|nr:heavy metal-binding domain-containing protein [Clostridiales bacterium]MDU6973934.1 heavy metal-binding domain-containing protein [Clostridiales bacterium]